MPTAPLDVAGVGQIERSRARVGGPGARKSGQCGAWKTWVVVAAGLIPFLTHEQLVTLLRQVTTHFPGGELAFNSYTRFNMWVIHHLPGLKSIAEISVNPGFDDPRDPERWGTGLTFVEEIFETRRPEVDLLPRGLRLSTRLMGRSAALSRWGIVIFRYRF